MIFLETELKGAFIVELERREDARGFFARSFCVRELEALGLSLDVVQCNVAFTHGKGTLRGLHYQVPTAAETKLMRCMRGGVFDVIVDLRPESPTYLRHIGVELSAENRRAVLVPQFFAHGYQTLVDESEMTYLVDKFYNPSCERGVRYDDPALAIGWPLTIGSVSDKDAAWPLLKPALAQAAPG
jgi:dTDP-4-dehydrorhamnose 3,5-epimerase